MRKHPLIALTAFTALGASAVAGASTGTFTSNSVLTSNKSHHLAPSSASRRHAPSVAYEGLIGLSNVSLYPASTGIMRSLIAVHDPDRVDSTRLDALTGLPQVPKAHPKKRPQVTLANNTQPTQTTTVVTVAPLAEATPTTTAPAPPQAPSGGVWYELRMCESGDNYSDNTGNGYYGAYQFSLSTWYGLGFTGLPSNAPPAVQDRAASELQAEYGWGQWPACSAALGL